MEKKKLYIVNDASSTKYLPSPLKEEDIVEEVEDENNPTPEGYLRVKHGEFVSVFFRNRFKRHIVKTK